MAGAEMEMLAGDTEAAERELRDAIDVATEMGASRYVALYRTRLAHVLIAQGRDEDAARRARAGAGALRALAALEGGPRARARARGRGRGGGRARARSGRVGGRQRRHHGARRDPDRPRRGAPRARRCRRRRGCLAEAVGLHEEKGNVLAAERCRRLLASMRREEQAATPG